MGAAVKRSSAVVACLLWAAQGRAVDAVGVSITIDGFPNPEANVVAGLFDNPEGFRAGKDPVRSASFPSPGSSITWRVNDLPPGNYGLLAYQDLNGNDELDLDTRGRPLEPYAVSGKPVRGAPRFKRARIEFNNDVQALRLDQWRVRPPAKDKETTRRDSSS